MKYPYIVNKDGVWYPAGTEVPVGDKPVENKADDFSKYMNAPEKETEAKYTKTDINRMPLAELKEVAIANGIVGAEEMTGAELKKALIEHFEL